MKPTTIIETTPSTQTAKIHRASPTQKSQNVWSGNGYTTRMVDAWSTACGYTFLATGYIKDLGPSLLEARASKLCKNCFNTRDLEVSIMAESREVY